jgi:hypothetical protein
MRHHLGAKMNTCDFLFRKCDSDEYIWEPLCKYTKWGPKEFEGIGGNL